jgi:predicted NodU family carbamoyl transferase
VIILGLQFGHDAGIMLMCDGKVLRSLIRERHNRAKHAFSMDTAHIDLVLEEAGLGADDIDVIALTSGQCYELVSDNSGIILFIIKMLFELLKVRHSQAPARKESFRQETAFFAAVTSSAI